MDFIFATIVFIIVIGVLVTVHEFGHFIAARMSGMRVDVFSIGMGKRLFGFNKTTGFTFGPLDESWESNGITDYRIALLPIGGYVKIAGMVDESLDTQQLAEEPQPWEFRSKNAFLKAFTISAGVIMNFVLAVGVFAAIAFYYGVEQWNVTTIEKVVEGSPIAHLGLQDGDRIVEINGQQAQNWKDVLFLLTLDKFGEAKDITVERNGERISWNSSSEQITAALTSSSTDTEDLPPEARLGLYPQGFAIRIGGVNSVQPAGKAGLQAQDYVVSLNGERIFTAERFKEIVSGHKGQPILVTWLREGEEMSSMITPTKEGVIGVEISGAFSGEKINVRYGLAESVVEGYHKSIDMISLIWQSMKQLVSGKLSFKDSFGGPIMIAKQGAKHAEMGLPFLLDFIGKLSIMLAFLNIMPFPVLDGGHLVFILIEGVMRREVPMKIKMAIQQVGLIVLLIFMVVVLFFDFIRL